MLQASGILRRLQRVHIAMKAHKHQFLTSISHKSLWKLASLQQDIALLVMPQTLSRNVTDVGFIV